jgi:hypothetical protein
MMEVGSGTGIGMVVPRGMSFMCLLTDCDLRYCGTALGNLVGGGRV